MAEWYVYQHDGDPLGPWSTEAVADAILAGRLAADVWVAAPGGPRWLRALDVPVIGRLVEGIPTRPRRDSGLRLMPGFVPAGQMPSFESTMMMVKDDEVEADPVSTQAATTRRTDPEAAHLLASSIVGTTPPALTVEDAPKTEPSLPPASSSSSPSPPPAAPNYRETMASVGNEKRRRRKV